MGSLFKLRDYWYGKYNGEEFSHTAALTVGNADNNCDGENQIILGSFSGFLRIIRPTKKGAALPEDILIEKDMREPILQVACRPLEPVNGGNPRNLVAILLPRRLLLTRVLREGKTGSGDGNKEESLNNSCRLMIYHSASLEYSSYNFTYGTFGHASHEMICVQSMDGRLTIIDHNTVVLRCFIPTSQFLLPGCLAYCSFKDCFLTNNSAMYLMCYSFANITCNRVMTDMRIGVEEQKELQNRNDIMEPSWVFLLGEDAVGIEICRHTRGLEKDDADIVVLCQYTLFILRLNGELRYSKRLDVECLCLTSYPVYNINACNIIIGTITGSINVFSDMSLEWSAKMTTGAPQCLEVAEFFNTKGHIISLSTEGTVAVNYLGTDPEEEPLQPLESKEADYIEMEQELKKLQYAIKQVSNNEISVKNKIKVDNILHVSWEPLLTEVDEKEDISILTLKLRNESNKEITGEINILIEVIEPIKVDIQQRIINLIPLNDIIQIPFRFTAINNNDMIIPSSLEVRAIVMFMNENGTNYTVTSTVRLPFKLVAKPIQIVKKTDFVMQLNTEKEVPLSLLDLFPDMSRNGEITSNVMSLQYINGADVTLLVSKNACRFRLQSSTMEALWLLADELQRRLYNYYGPNDVQLSIPDPIPLENYFAVIDTHLSIRKEMINFQEELSRAAQMFRSVQRRLLVLFRERNPIPVGMMETLFNESYSKLQKCADNITISLPRQKQAAAMLCSCSRLVLLYLIIKCRESLKNLETIHLLESIFTCSITSESTVGWEEITDVALGHILEPLNRTTTVRANSLASNEVLSINLDAERLKKRITALFDKIQGGFQTTASISLSGPPGSTVAVAKGKKKRNNVKNSTQNNLTVSSVNSSSTPIQSLNLKEVYESLLISSSSSSSGRRQFPFATNFINLPSAKGILNNSNSCFMNAILQTLIFIPPFAQLAISAINENEICPTLSILGKWFISYWAKAPTQSIPPLRLPLISHSSKDNSHSNSSLIMMNGSAQEDAPEFMHRLLETIQLELCSLEKKFRNSDNFKGNMDYSSQIDNNETKGWTFVKGKERLSVREQNDERHSILFETIFGGAVESHLKGKSKLKDHASVVVEGFFILQVDVCFGADCTLELALERTLQTERVHDSAREKDLLKTVKIRRLPSILILQLRRWAVTAEGELVKLDNIVRFPKTLVLPKSTCSDMISNNQSRSYELLGFVVHRGKATERGHYVSYLTNTSLSSSTSSTTTPTKITQSSNVVTKREGELLTLCNDARISTSTLRGAIETEAVYILVYQRNS